MRSPVRGHGTNVPRDRYLKPGKRPSIYKWRRGGVRVRLAFQMRPAHSAAHRTNLRIEPSTQPLMTGWWLTQPDSRANRLKPNSKALLDPYDGGSLEGSYGEPATLSQNTENVGF